MTLPPKPKTDAEVDGAVSALLRLRLESEEVRADLERLEGEVAVAQVRLRDVDAASLREASDRLHLGVAGTQMSPDPRGQVPGHARTHAGLDVLTSLPNRDVMMGRFVQAIEVAKRTGSRIALLFIDLDHFKRVNDTFGHSAGDAVLKQVAGCLAGAVREVDTVSRHGGDEFLVLLPDISDVAEAERVASQVVAALQAAGASSEHCPGLAASIGISVYPEDGDSPTVLIDRADAAMYVAKRRGTSHVVAHGHAARRGRAVRDPGPVKLVRSAADRAPSPKRPQATPADLRDANGALVRAAIGAQELQVAAELSLR
ncbi:MAG: GGDEF domain-containing protein, partial [Pseudoxanthomonas sp.]|nr:GGDEF domain-containing protein [Pseudoxanthomonas sp.]